MTFPSAGLLIREFHILLLAGPLAVLGAVGYWVYRLLRRPPASPTSSRILMASVGACLIGGVHLLGISALFRNVGKFRFDPKDVTELRIVRVDEEGRPNSNPEKTIRGRALVTDGLSRLADSAARSRNHERYSDGYRILIVIPGTPSEDWRYVSVYRRSSREGGVTVAIPHIGESHSGLMNHVGEYECPRFLDWVATAVDPLFR